MAKLFDEICQPSKSSSLARVEIVRMLPLIDMEDYVAIVDVLILRFDEATPIPTVSYHNIRSYILGTGLSATEKDSPGASTFSSRLGFNRNGKYLGPESRARLRYSFSANRQPPPNPATFSMRDCERTQLCA
eukprot:scaffold7349_cov173-Amphora_coffeaeformis.AAC.64